MVDMPRDLILALEPLGSQSPDRGKSCIPHLGEGEEIAEYFESRLRVVLGELCEVRVPLQNAAHARNGQAEVNRREKVRERYQRGMTDPRIRRLGGSGYTELVYGKSW